MKTILIFLFCILPFPAVAVEAQQPTKYLAMQKNPTAPAAKLAAYKPRFMPLATVKINRERPLKVAAKAKPKKLPQALPPESKAQPVSPALSPDELQAQAIHDIFMQ